MHYYCVYVCMHVPELSLAAGNTYISLCALYVYIPDVHYYKAMIACNHKGIT